MRKEKRRIIDYLKRWGILFILSFAIIIFIIDVYEAYTSFRTRSEYIRENYVIRQKEEIQRQVMQTVRMINFQLGLIRKRAREMVRERGLLAYTFIENFYFENKGKIDNEEIKKIVINNLKKIIFEVDSGGYFIDSLSGKIIMMMPKNSLLEGKNIINIKNEKGEYVFKKQFEEIKKKGEIIVNESPLFSIEKNKKPHNKIVFLKLFRPFDWVIGSYVYVDCIEQKIEKELLENISKIRFGKEGYIFINRFNGDALVSNGKLYEGDKKLWEIFNKNPKEMKKIFKKEYNAALKPNGDYIYYSFIKLTNPNKKSPKASFIYGIPELKWIIGAGIYLDDVDKEIASIEKRLLRDIKIKLFYFILAVLAIVIIFLIVFNRLTDKFRNDLELFASFFDKAAYSDEYIDVDKIRFIEFGVLAESANKMVEEKSEYQQELLDEKERLFVTIRSIGDGVITTDEKGKIIIMNKMAEKLTGWTLKEVYGKDLKEVFKIVEENTREPLESLVEKVLKSGKVEKLEEHTILISKNGEEYKIEDSAAPIRDIKSKIKGVVVVFRDITEKARMEEELLKVRKLESVGILAGGIAHDFNNILTGIFGNIEIAKMKIEKKHPAYKFIKIAGKALDRAVSLTKQLLTFAKGGEPILGVVDLENVIKNTVNFILSGSKIKAHYQIADNLCKIKADKGQISEVLSNIIINAKEAMPEGGNIYITAENIKIMKNGVEGYRKGDYVKLSIKDEGVGISKKYIDKIFDPFFTTKKAGNGLGLAVTHSIIKKHNGWIEVDSTIDEGTVFTIYLPVAEKSSKRKEVEGKKIMRESKKKYRILVMDDEDFILDVVKEMLESIGYQVETAKEGREAINKYKRSKSEGKPFDLVIMDLTIPGGLGGKETIIEFLNFNKDVKVIVSSGYSTDPVMSNYKEYGFKGRLVKPFNFEQLKEELHKILETDK